MTDSPRTQPATYECECGRHAPVTQVTAYEFDVVCPCGRHHTLSWKHGEPAPHFTPEPQARLPLRSEGSEP